MRYYLDTDGDGHWFVIPDSRESDWNDWVEDEEDWEVPEWADSINGWPGRVRFEDYEIT